MNIQRILGDQEKKWEYLSIGGMFLVTFVLMGCWMVFEVYSDIYTHYLHILAIIRFEQLPIANFLYYITVAALALFQTNGLILGVVMGLVLSASVTAKYFLTRRFLIQQWGPQAHAHIGIITGIAVLLMFAMSLPGPDTILLGKQSPTIWHNSTLIFVMPFALALFFSSYQYLESGSNQLLIQMTVWVGLNIIAKPSFFFCFVCVFPLMSLLRLGWTREWLKSLIPVILGGFLLVLQFYFIYVFVSEKSIAAPSTIEIRPFYVWHHYANGHVVWSWIASGAFPLACLMVFPHWLKDKMMQYTLLLAGVGYLIFILLVEAGPREFDGNFGWQVIVCNFIWFMVSWGNLLSEIQTRSRPRLIFTGLVILFGLHVLTGFGYLFAAFFTQNAFI